MNNFKPLVLASAISLMSAPAISGPLKDVLGTGGIAGELNLAARSIQSGASANNPTQTYFGRTNTPTLFGVTVFEPANRQNADIAALSVGSGDNTGNGGAVGVAVLAGDQSGNGGLVGVAALSPNENLAVSVGGTDVIGLQNQLDAIPVIPVLESFGAGNMNEPLYDGLGREPARGGYALTEQIENQVRSTQTSSSGASPLGGVSSNTIPGFGTADVASVSGFEGNDAASGSDIGVAVLNNGSGSADSNLIGVAAITGNDAARGDLVNIAVVGGDNSAQGGLVNVAALSGSNSAQGGVVNVQLANEPTTTIGNNEAVLNLAVLHRSQNVDQGTVGIGIITVVDPSDPPEPPKADVDAMTASAEAENCGGAHEVTIRGVPVVAGPRLGTQFSDSRAETKIGECARGA